MNRSAIETAFRPMATDTKADLEAKLHRLITIAAAMADFQETWEPLANVVTNVVRKEFDDSVRWEWR